MIYKDGKSGYTMMKRFPVSSITRNKDYCLTKSETASKVLYFTPNPNGEAEIVTIHLRKLAKLKTLKFDINFADLTIKGKGAGGNIVTKNIVRKVELKSRGVSTLSALKIWYDSTVQRLNVDQRGELLGSFKSSDRILTLHKSGSIELKSFDLSNHFDSDIIHIEHCINKCDTVKENIQNIIQYEQENERECPICLEELGDNNYVKTNCNHKTCVSCFVSNIKLNNKTAKLCPLCREQMY